MSQSSPDVDDERLWYAVRAKPNREEEACFHFARQGFEVYLPCILVQRRHAGKQDIVRRPFFSGYLFLHLAAHERQWGTIASTRGAVCAVHFGEHYPPMPDEVIRQLKAREDAQGCIVLHRPQWRPGQEVLVRMDDNTVIDGIFLAQRGEERALILLTMLQQRVTSLVATARLEAGSCG